MKFFYLTLFPHLIEPYFQDSILKRALDKKLFSIECIDFRNFSKSRHQKVDNTIIGGGAGMLLQLSPIQTALFELKKNHPKAKVVFVTPSGKSFDQNDAKRLSKEESIILVSGRYEGFDERLVENYADEVFSIGDFVLTGGELASLVITDATVRHIFGVLGNHDSLEEESFSSELLESPHFTKDNAYTNLKYNKVPSDLLNGNHAKISSLKKEMAISKTKFHRPDLYRNYITRKSYEK